MTSKSVQWRRDKVRDLDIKGYTQRDMAAELQVPLGTIVKDLKFMRQQSKQNIQHYVDEYLPTEYENAISTLDMITKEMWELKTEDNRELIQSRMLIKDCTAMKVELISSGTVVDRAIKFVDRHRGLIGQNKEVTLVDTVEHNP